MDYPRSASHISGFRRRFGRFSLKAKYARLRTRPPSPLRVPEDRPGPCGATGSSARRVAPSRTFAPSKQTRLAEVLPFPFWREVSDTPRQPESGRLLTSCARQLITKINPAHRRRPAGHKPAGRKSTTPFAVPRKGGRLPSHARESCPDRIRILSQSDGEFAGLRLQ